MLKKFATLMIGVLLSSAVQAAPRKTTRQDWFYGKNYLHREAGTQNWTETINASPTFYFVEENRNDVYIELYDSSRQMYVRLYDNEMTLKGPGDSTFRHQVYGNWDDRRLWSWNYGGQIGYFQIHSAEMWWMSEPNQEVHKFLRERKRDDEAVYVFYGELGVTYKLTDTALYMATGDIDDGNLAYQLVYSGAWD